MIVIRVVLQMNNIMQKRWFNARPRTNLSNFVDQELYNTMSLTAHLATHDSDDKDVLYKQAVTSGLMTCLMFIKYACVDPSVRKPWFARKPIKQILDFKEFKSYSDDVVMWLNTQPPSSNYSALVYISTIIKFLTTMEFKDDT